MKDHIYQCKLPSVQHGAYMKSIIKYPGGKLWLVPRVERLIKEVSPECVAEPFCGGLSLSLNYEFKRVIANDVISPLINLYRHAQFGGIPNRDDWVFTYDDYMNVRSEFRQLCTDGKCNSQYSADMFWYLVSHGFNGLVRFNKKGLWNVPPGDYDKIATPQNFSEFARVTKDWEFHNKSYDKLDLSKANLIFADPPYASKKFNKHEGHVFSNYSGNAFKDVHQRETAEWLSGFDVPVIATNSANRDLAKIYKALGFHVYLTMAPRSISRNGYGRTKVPEMIAFKGFGLNRKYSMLVDGLEYWSL